ncbi:MAG: hypothetical protein JRF59_04095 [Deltaproteobacteria bacterium]|nr:hypothetical protein [Deltaproteobacteria bacterium]MBW1922945.1 hypothetical protein [Deltaproteobacteria bacterium]MBW1950692.1 hypothetical protein [Deltaproteobacteria bacterium]MBW2008536.1 hypothetical protein [Deltaproteobacteria bacterium]MBW2101614.1 hypothetical protein [Deltaproteobacteria bacterium]
MKIRLVRHATHHITLGGLSFLVDPMLSPGAVVLPGQKHAAFGNHPAPRAP